MSDKLGVVFFFFSSRRRHTRSFGDWSSDVCSSDLGRGSTSLGMQPGALPFPRKELSPREALAVCTPPAPPAETVEGNPNSVWSMVGGWGARWHEWRPPFECPHCKADLRDHRTGPPFKREVGRYDMARDRTT